MANHTNTARRYGLINTAVSEVASKLDRGGFDATEVYTSQLAFEARQLECFAEWLKNYGRGRLADGTTLAQAQASPSWPDFCEECWICDCFGD